jgi:hypothetical protein
MRCNAQLKEKMSEEERLIANRTHCTMQSFCYSVNGNGETPKPVVKRDFSENN